MKTPAFTFYSLRRRVGMVTVTFFAPENYQPEGAVGRGKQGDRWVVGYGLFGHIGFKLTAEEALSLYRALETEWFEHANEADNRLREMVTLMRTCPHGVAGWLHFHLHLNGDLRRPSP